MTQLEELRLAAESARKEWEKAQTQKGLDTPAISE
jgi:hypothetical protein